MVICAGYYCYDTFVKLFDFHKKDMKEIKVEKHPENIETIDRLFKTIKKEFNERIDCFCVYLGSKYDNEFRKKFIDVCKIQNGIKTVKISGILQLRLYCAIKNLSITPTKKDIIFVIFIHKHLIYTQIWEYGENDRWNFETYKEIPIDGLQDLKDIIENIFKYEKTKPNIFVIRGNVAVDKDKIEKIFSSYKIIDYSDSEGAIAGFQEYAQNYFKKNISLYYQSTAVLEKCFRVTRKVKKGFIKKDETLVYIERPQKLPLSVAADFDAKTGDVIKLYEYLTIRELQKAEGTLHDDDETQPSLFLPIQKDGKYTITLSIDDNGIYTLDLKFKKVLKENQKLYYIPAKLSNYDPMQNAIGIDFGTTECCAAVIRKNGPDFIQLDPVTSNRTMPSYVAFDENVPKCGQIVVDRMRHKAEYSVYDIKRIFGKQFDEIIIDLLWPFKNEAGRNGDVFITVHTSDGKDTMTPEEISAALLQHIKSVAENYQGNTLKEAVITIPCAFSEKQKLSLKTAAQIAGWKTVHFIPEPVAAAFAYFSEINIPDESNTLICDCGGGTVDICIAKISSGKIEILNFDGDPYLGGRDFDRLLFNHFNAILKHKYRIDVMENSKKFILKQKCQDIKHNLSVSSDCWLDVSDLDPDNNDIIKITRDEFETMASDLMLRVKNIICQTFNNTDLQRNQINYVFQVGGGCQMPIIKDLLQEIFPKAKHQCTLYPDWVVAHGAALYAYYLKNERKQATKGKESLINAEKYTVQWRPHGRQERSPERFHHPS